MPIVDPLTPEEHTILAKLEGLVVPPSKPTMQRYMAFLALENKGYLDDEWNLTDKGREALASAPYPPRQEG